jgi:hypothetical protein
MKRLAGILLWLFGCDGSYMPAAPATPPSKQRIATGELRLVGTGDSACSRAVGGHDLWCAFTRPGADLRAAEIWAVDVTRAAQGGVVCDAPGPSCLRLTDNAWTHVPLFSASYPSIDEFEGETLFLYTNPPGDSGNSGDPFVGAIQGWRPGWSGPRTLSSDKGYACHGSPGAAVGYCLDDVQTVMRNPQFELRAGALSATTPAPLASLGRLSALGAGGQVMWGVAFSPGGESLAFSGPAADGQGEVLRVIATADIGRGTPTKLLDRAPRWRLSADGSKLYYLADFNYADRNDQPAGVLTMVDFPAGTNPRALQPGVGAFSPLGEAGGKDEGIGFLQDMSGGFGTLRVLRDRAHPDQAATLEDRVEDYTISSDARYGYLYKPEGSDGPQTLVVRTDGASRCVLNTRPGGLPYLITFLPGRSMVLFIEDDVAGQAQAYYTNPDDCADKRHFASNLGFLTTAGTGVLYGEADPTGRTMTLKHAPAVDGALPEDGGTLLEPAIDTAVAVAGGRYVLYTLATGVPEDQGLYVYGPLP